MINNTSFSERLKAQSNQLKIGIIGAMDEEVELLKETLEGRQEHTVAGYSIYTGSMHGIEVVLLKSGIGKVNAAIGTTLMLQEFQPTCVINTGSAGGFSEELEVGDVVISTEVRHHDVDVTIFGYEHGQLPGLPAAFTPDGFLADVAQRCIARMEGIKTVQGLIATGDSFMNCPERVAKTRENFPAMKAVEMEAAAIAQTCHQFDIPFIVIRSLSDIAGKESNLSFEQFLVVAAKHSAEMVMAIVQTISDEAA
ncbi:5'-methylthioadenosine/S-adenosylhomocysteine nucleosidase [Amphritea japonica]|uniref:5'-methylthioadenosine/S-adenosylhomocysteine nucleosidase n=1 Tax=Amphritea japonica ATCC BAA-1530 TaxID=1278309 RepID=A0A7R6SSG5_9GAMM|nr:5'-methylthioadenosine/S-adenosylhomocysteine nucleosidase [Amphritea japonica]BBB26230.1 S-adenosylhomocysteine/5'-methylthioadenosine nucleosidase [Amphritea japonica ATCC BAA-1530]